MNRMHFASTLVWGALWLTQIITAPLNGFCESVDAAAAVASADTKAITALPDFAGDGPVFVIPIEGQIEGALVYVFRRGLEEAYHNNARVIVLDMDTPGGSLDSIWKIMEMLLRSPVPTVTYVHPNAISGGAMIALATDYIVMSPGSVIGDAKPILGSPIPFGGASDLPDGLREKVLSPTRAKVRSACQAKGRDPLLGEAMVDESVLLDRDGETISAVGSILTLTSDEASKLYGDPPAPLLSVGTFGNLDALLEHLKADRNDVRWFRITSTERLARVLAGPLAPFLLGLALLMLYIEFKTPGFGIPGISGIALLALWFWGQHIAALAGMAEVAIFLLGVILLAVEIFLIPGFGLTGVLGLVLMLAGLLMAMITRFPGGGSFDFAPEAVGAAAINLTLTLLTTTLGAWAAAKFLPKTALFRRISLDSTIDGISHAPPPETLAPGVQGITLTPCRPGGVGSFAGERLDIVSTGEFLESDTPVQLVRRRERTWEVTPL